MKDIDWMSIEYFKDCKIGYRCDHDKKCIEDGRVCENFTLERRHYGPTSGVDFCADCGKYYKKNWSCGCKGEKARYFVKKKKGKKSDYEPSERVLHFRE